MDPQKTLLHWSGGKDSAITLGRLQSDHDLSLEHLVVSVTESTERVTMHGVRLELIEAQGKALGLPLTVMKLPDQPDMQTYNHIFHKCMARFFGSGFTHSAFGDIFLDDLRSFRENLLQKSGLKPLFPVWGENTTALAEEFIHDGFRAVIVCTDSSKLGRTFLGREYDEKFLEELPAEVDPCGENGEFHTFVYDGPFFKNPVSIRSGEIVFREYPDPSKNDDVKNKGFWLLDLMSDT